MGTNPFLFNEDKTKILLSETRKLLWQGDGQATSGVSISFSDLNINPTDFNYFYLVTVDGSGQMDGSILIPRQPQFNGTITKSKTTLTDGSNNTRIAIQDTYERMVMDFGMSSMAMALIGIGACIDRHEEWSTTGTDSRNYSRVTNHLIPYQLWGIM